MSGRSSILYVNLMVTPTARTKVINESKKPFAGNLGKKKQPRKSNGSYASQVTEVNLSPVCAHLLPEACVLD